MRTLSSGLHSIARALKTGSLKTGSSNSFLIKIDIYDPLASLSYLLLSIDEHDHARRGQGRVSPCVSLSGSRLQAEQTHGGGARGEGGCQRGRSVADLEGHERREVTVDSKGRGGRSPEPKPSRLVAEKIAKSGLVWVRPCRKMSGQVGAGY